MVKIIKEVMINNHKSNIPIILLRNLLRRDAMKYINVNIKFAHFI